MQLLTKCNLEEPLLRLFAESGIFAVEINGTFADFKTESGIVAFRNVRRDYPEFQIPVYHLPITDDFDEAFSQLAFFKNISKILRPSNQKWLSCIPVSRCL